MKVLMLSTDNKIFKKGSAVRQRMIEYGKLFSELRLVVYTTRKVQIPTDNFQINLKTQISNNVWIYPTNSKFRIFSFWDAYKIANRLFSDLILEIRDSVITVQDPFETGFAGYLLKKRLKLPLQVQIHTDFLSPYFWQESFANKIRVLLAKFLIRRADGIRVVSERIKRSLMTQYGFRIKSVMTRKINVMPIFVDVKKIQSAPIKVDLHKKYPGRDFIILMASRLTREKNIEMAVEAVREILAMNHSAKYLPAIGLSRKRWQAGKLNTKMGNFNPLLLIVGDGPEKDNLQSLIDNYQLRHNVVIEPWNNDLASYYKTADLFLLTSNYEGYGRTAVEAMAAGLPVLMTDVGLAGETLIDDLNGAIVPVGDSAALAEKILKFAGDRVYREKIREAAKNAPVPYKSKKEYLAKFKAALNL